MTVPTQALIERQFETEPHPKSILSPWAFTYNLYYSTKKRQHSFGILLVASVGLLPLFRVVHVFFYKNKVYKKMRLKSSKILRKSFDNHEAQLPKLSVFIGQKAIFCSYCFQNVKDGIQIQVYNINNESVYHSSQFISVKVKKNLRKSRAQFWEKLRKLRLRQSSDFLIKKRVVKFRSTNRIFTYNPKKINC